MLWYNIPVSCSLEAPGFRGSYSGVALLSRASEVGWQEAMFSSRAGESGVSLPLGLHLDVSCVVYILAVNCD